MTAADNKNHATLLDLTSDIVVAHLSNNTVPVAQVPGLISSVFSALATLGEQTKPDPSRPEPAVAIRASVKPDYLICLEDGKKLTMLKRYLRTNFDMSPDQYRARWNLSPDYPMVAPNYAERRRALAKQIGLGRRPANATTVPDSETVKAP